MKMSVQAKVTRSYRTHAMFDEATIAAINKRRDQIRSEEERPPNMSDIWDIKEVRSFNDASLPAAEKALGKAASGIVNGVHSDIGQCGIVFSTWKLTNWSGEEPRVKDLWDQ